LLTAGEHANGVYITTNMNRDDENETVQQYIKRYREEYNLEPDMVGASTYDAFQVVFEAIRRAGTDPVAMRNAIASMTDFYTVTGNLTRYTKKGEAVKPVQIQRVEDGQFHYFSVLDDLDIITPDE